MLLTNQGSRFLRKRAATSDWWTVAGQTCVAAYKPIGEVDLATSYINLANPGTYNAAPGAAPGLAAGGWTFDGTQWLDTGYVPVKQVTSVLERFTHTASNYLLGCGGVGFEFYIQPNNGGYSYYASGGALGPLGAHSSGVIGMAGNNAYIDGVAEAGTIGAGVVEINRTIHIGDQNTTYSASPYYALVGTIAAVAIYSTTLSAADVASLSARMALLA